MMAMATTFVVKRAFAANKSLVGFIRPSQPLRGFHQTCCKCQQRVPTGYKQQQQKQKKDKDDRAYILLVVPAITFCLGTWQVQRRKWKLGLIKDMEERTSAPPVPLPDNYSELESMEYRRVKVRGSFDHSGEMYILPRSKVTDESGGGGGMISQSGGIGSYVITPFYIPERNIRILVNRGWVSRDKEDPKTRPQGQIDGEIDLIGLVRQSERRKVTSSQGGDRWRIWHRRDIEGMAEAVDAEPILIDADTKSTVPGGPIGGQTRVSLRNEHLSYIATWYSLSGLTSYMWYTRYFRR